MSVLGDFHGGMGNLTFNSKDISNLRTHLRVGVRYRDMDVVLEYFQKLQAESPNFFYAVKLDAENAVRGLFWVDGRSGSCTSASGIAYSLTRRSTLTGTTCPLHQLMGSTIMPKASY